MLKPNRNNLKYAYVGPVWHRLTGTGESIRIMGLSMGDYAEMHFYSGDCNGPICIVGKYSIQSSPQQLADLKTIAGQEYFIMIGNYDLSSPVPNIETYQLEIQCLCGNVAMDLRFPQ